LPRKLGEATQREFAVNIFDERSEILLDDESKLTRFVSHRTIGTDCSPT